MELSSQNCEVHACENEQTAHFACEMPEFGMAQRRSGRPETYTHESKMMLITVSDEEDPSIDVQDPKMSQRMSIWPRWQVDGTAVVNMSIW